MKLSKLTACIALAAAYTSGSVHAESTAEGNLRGLETVDHWWYGPIDQYDKSCFTETSPKWRGSCKVSDNEVMLAQKLMALNSDVLNYWKETKNRQVQDYTYQKEKCNLERKEKFTMGCDVLDGTTLYDIKMVQDPKDVFGLIAKIQKGNGENATILSYAGTQVSLRHPIDSIQSILTDKTSQTLGSYKVHGTPYEVDVANGFVKAYIASLQDLSARIDALIPGSDEIIITGHSLGGALAQIAAAFLKYQKPGLKIRLYTFAAPRSFGPNTSKMMNENFKSFPETQSSEDLLVTRWYTVGDFVPTIPGTSTEATKNFHHVGNAIRINLSSYLMNFNDIKMNTQEAPDLPFLGDFTGGTKTMSTKTAHTTYVERLSLYGESKYLDGLQSDLGECCFEIVFKEQLIVEKTCQELATDLYQDTEYTKRVNSGLKRHGDDVYACCHPTRFQEDPYRCVE